MSPGRPGINFFSRNIFFLRRPHGTFEYNGETRLQIGQEMTKLLIFSLKKKKKKSGRVESANKVTRPVDRKRNYF